MFPTHPIHCYLFPTLSHNTILSVSLCNFAFPELAQHEKDNKEGIFTTHENCFAVDTGIFTGRSPKDRWIVKNAGSIR